MVVTRKIVNKERENIMTSNVARTVAQAFLLCGIFVSVGVIHAAETPIKQTANQQTALSDKDLKAFVKAYVDYQRIRSTYGPALDNAKDPAQKQKIEREANAKIKQSLDAQGLSAERYNQIFAQVNSNEPLRKKVLKQVEEERRKS
jgi:uncharacterized protein DUF4168